MKLFSLTVLAGLLVGCSTPAPIDLHGHPPPQNPIKGPSGMLLRKYTALTPNGPEQRCVYTIDGTDRFVLNEDICYAYVLAPQSASEALTTAMVNEHITLKQDTSLGTSVKSIIFNDQDPPLKLKMDTHLSGYHFNDISLSLVTSSL